MSQLNFCNVADPFERDLNTLLNAKMNGFEKPKELTDFSELVLNAEVFLMATWPKDMMPEVEVKPCGNGQYQVIDKDMEFEFNCTESYLKKLCPARLKQGHKFSHTTVFSQQGIPVKLFTIVDFKPSLKAVK